MAKYPKVVIRRTATLMNAYIAAKAGNVKEAGEQLVAAVEDGFLDPVFEGVATTIQSGLEDKLSVEEDISLPSDDTGLDDFNPNEYTDGDSLDDPSDDMVGDDLDEDVDAKTRCNSSSEEESETIEIPASVHFLSQLRY